LPLFLSKRKRGYGIESAERFRTKTKNTPCGVFFERELFFALLLERCADRVCAGGSVAGADVDLFGCAGGAAVVVNAVGNVANDAAVAAASVLFIFMIHHN
jgi:hypothetical protein